MASGINDWSKGVNIRHQILPEIINRPKYGSPSKVATSILAAANDTTILAYVTGKGMIYGGFIYATSIATQKNDIADIFLDGETFTAGSFLTLSTLNLIQEYSSIPHLIKYDDVGFHYTVSFYTGLTFETDIYIYYTETHGRTPVVATVFYYATI